MHSHNQISEITGLEHLKNLKTLNLGWNKISEDIIEACGGLDNEGHATYSQKFVRHSQEQKLK